MKSVFNPGPSDLYGVRWLPKLGPGNKLIRSVSPDGDPARNDIEHKFLFNRIAAQNPYLDVYWVRMPSFEPRFSIRTLLRAINMLSLRANKRKLLRQRGVSDASAKFPLICAHLQHLVRSRDEF